MDASDQLHANGKARVWAFREQKVYCYCQESNGDSLCQLRRFGIVKVVRSFRTHEKDAAKFDRLSGNRMTTSVKSTRQEMCTEGKNFGGPLVDLPPLGKSSPVTGPEGSRKLTHCRRLTQICVYALQLWKTDNAHLRFNTRLVSTHYIL